MFVEYFYFLRYRKFVQFYVTIFKRYHPSYHHERERKGGGVSTPLCHGFTCVCYLRQVLVVGRWCIRVPSTTVTGNKDFLNSIYIGNRCEQLISHNEYR